MWEKNDDTTDGRHSDGIEAVGCDCSDDRVTVFVGVGIAVGMEIVAISRHVVRCSNGSVDNRNA